MSLSRLEVLRHVLDEIRFVAETIDELTEDMFMRDGTIQRAFVRSIEIIGEAVKKIQKIFGIDIQMWNGDQLRECAIN